MTNKEMKQIMRDAIRPMLVAKIESDKLPTHLAGWYPTLNDCFLLGTEARRNMSVHYCDKDGERIAIPSAGSKFIGAYRDKGSITGVMSRYLPFCQYKLVNEQEVENFCQMLFDLDKEFTVLDDNTVEFQIDIVADVSIGRDNVVALLLDSCMNLTSIIEDRDIQMSLEEINSLDIREVVNSRQFDHIVFVRDMETGETVHNFGETGILLEDFFWQPSHDNSLSAREKEISFSYHQAKDAMVVLAPTLYKAMIESLDYSSIHEDLILLGVEMSEDFETVRPERKIQIISDDDDDEL